MIIFNNMMKHSIIISCCLLVIGKIIEAQQVSYSYQPYFEAAYRIHPTIPRGMLEAVAWHNTRLHHITAQNETESCMGMPLAKGVMGLIDNGKGYFRNTAYRVAQLSGMSLQEIINNPEKNILAYAKAFEQLQYQYRIFSSRPEDYVPILDALSEIPSDRTVVNDFAFQTQLYGIFTFLTNPVHAASYNFPVYQINLRQLFGANYDLLSSTAIRIDHKKIISNNGATFHQRSGSRSADYGPAIWNPAASCNYSSRNGVAVSAVTIHTVQGSYAGCISWFQNCNAGVSAHYVIRSSDGQVTQMVRESDKAWHVGSENAYTIGIEHEGYINNPSWYTSAMYQSSADLVKDICTSGYGINPLRTHYGPSCSGSSSQCQLGGCIRIKGHQHYPNQTHSDPGPHWNWTHYYHLINDNTPVITYTAPSGTFYDSGGPSGNYANDERKLYLIKPAGATQITLTFSTFQLENNWDFLYVYDGDHLNAPLLGRYTGSTIPAPITSSGNALLIQFRSDCATVAAGWAASWNTNGSGPTSDTIRPTTTVHAPATWITQNFTTTFSDVDNINGSGIEKSYYSVHYYHQQQWDANEQRGFRCDLDAVALLSRWTVVSGTWINENGYLTQTDESLSNTNIFAPLTQNLSNQYVYEWQGKIEGSGTNRRAGFHYFCDDATLTNRGNSYFVWFREELDQLEFYRVTNNTFSLQKNVSYPFQAGVWYHFRVIYDRITGRHEVYINDKFVADWTDPNPISNGSYISFRSGNSKYSVSNVRVYRSRAATVQITVGGSVADIPYENPSPGVPAARICSITKDASKNMSHVSCNNVNVDFSPPLAIVSVIDGIGTDQDSSTTTTSLAGSWTPAHDPHSGIAKYYFAIGTSPGATDFQNWTSNGTNTSFILHNITLNVGTTYYLSVKSENNAGLQSSIATSDGIYIYNIPLCSTYTVPAPTISVSDHDTICPDATTTLYSPAGYHSYQWSDGSSTLSHKVGAGTYTLTVTDANGCTAANSITISAYPAITYYIHTQDISCYGGTDGLAMIQPTGGDLPFTYQWSTGSNDSIIISLSAGHYSASVIDIHGCVAVQSFIISEPMPLEISFQITYESTYDQYAVYAQITGGVAPYRLNWDNQSGNNPVILQAGWHTLQVTDQNGCTRDTSFLLGELVMVLTSDAEPDVLTLYPNPARHQVFVNISEQCTKSLSLVIYSLDGTILSRYDEQIPNNISLYNLTSGIYLVLGKCNERYSIRKMVVMK